MMTRLIRRTPGALGFNALLPLDAISGRKLLYSNPRLLRSSPSGGDVSYPCPCVAWRFSLAVPRMPKEATEAASRPEGRLAVEMTKTAEVQDGYSRKALTPAISRKIASRIPNVSHLAFLLNGADFLVQP